MTNYWFCPLSFYEQNYAEISKNWDFVGYSEFAFDGVPKIVELRRKK